MLDSGAITSIEELAHIIGQSERGPRGEAALPVDQRDEYENLLLLCPNCHALVDRSPTNFPEALLKDWKNDHAQKLVHSFSVPEYADRQELATEVAALLRRNKEIFDTYGPFVEGRKLIDERARAWVRYVKEQIVPNNRRICQLLKKNDPLLKDAERAVAEKFLIHSEALEYNHLSGDKSGSAPLFPVEMNSILGD